MTTTTRAPSARRALDWAVMRRRLGRVLLYAILVSGCVATLLPFVWMILASFKSSSEIIRIPPTLWPENPTLANYETIFNDPKLPLGRFYLNSLIVAGSQVLMILFTSSLAGFVFAKYQFFGKGALFGFILATMMIPGQVTMIPGYLMLAKLGLIDSLWGLIIPSAVSAFGIFLMKQFIEGLPSELMDAARIDGASEWGIYWRIVLAQIGPALATLGILNFMGSWNSYLWPLIVITTHERRTLPIVLTWYDSVHAGRADLQMAAGVLVVLPILFVYTFLQRWIVQGIAMTGFK
jgi:multiple sugar transport system permease protein